MISTPYQSARTSVSPWAILVATVVLFSCPLPAGLAPLVTAARATGLSVVRPQFLVNSTQTLGAQTHPTIAMDTDGLMLVTWSTQSDKFQEIKARALHPDGQPWTKEFQVNTLVEAGYQHSPDVATSGGSEWIVTWASWEAGDQHRVYAKTFSSSILTLQTEIQVDADALDPSPRLSRPDVAMFPNGDSIVLWEWTDLAAGELIFYVRLYDRGGNPLSDPIQINQTPSVVPPVGSTGTPDLAVREIDGQMTAFAAWGRWKDEGELLAEVRCRRFNLHEMTFDDEVLISPPQSGFHQGRPSLDINGRGDILVTWQERDPADMLYDIHSMKYTAADSAWGGLLDPPGNAEFYQHRAQGLLSESGGIVLAWTRFNLNLSDDDVYLMMYDAAGTPLLAQEYRVNLTTFKVQRRPALAMSEADGFAHLGVVWESNVGDGSDYGIYAAVFDFHGFPTVTSFPPAESVDAAKGVHGKGAPLPAFGLEAEDQYLPAGSARGESSIGVFRGLSSSPNPFNPSTNIGFELALPAEVTLSIHDLAGRRVKVLTSGTSLTAGVHGFAWNGTDDQGQGVAAGVYFYRLQALGQTAAGRLTLIK
jgi:hypothetical protein